MTLDQLLADLDHAGVCTLDTGGRITAAEARRLACTAGIIPVVLGGESQVLDVGRTRRLHTESMRLAMGVRDGGCTAQGCETPPGLCHAHHDTPWSADGPTNVDTGRLLCPHHHRRVTTPSTRPDTCQATRSPSSDGRRHTWSLRRDVREHAGLVQAGTGNATGFLLASALVSGEYQQPLRRLL